MKKTIEDLDQEIKYLHSELRKLRDKVNLLVDTKGNIL